MKQTTYLLILFLFFYSFDTFSQLAESKFYYSITKKPYECSVSNVLNIRTQVDNSGIVTDFENDQFIRFIIAVWFNRDVEIQLTDSSDFNIKFYNLDETDQENLKVTKEFISKKNEYNCVAEYCNNSKDTFLFLSRFDVLYAILEGLDSDNNWKPLQVLYNRGYGDHAEVRLLTPGRTLLIPFSNKLGEQKVKMRMKLQGNDTLLISNTFDGMADTSIFNIKRENHLSHEDSIIYLEKSIFKNLEKYKNGFEIESYEE